MTIEDLTNDFQTYDKLRSKLWNLCNEYAKSNVLPQELKEYKFGYYEFEDFMLGKNGTVALFFNDEDGEPCQSYKTAKIEDLINCLYGTRTKR